MNFLFYLFIFALGAVIGSFLNVVVLRLNTGKSLNGRSMCFSCGKNLRWFELVPIFSFFIQRGRCRNCKTKISWQYVFVEFITGLVFLSIFLKIIPDSSIFYENIVFNSYLLIFYWTAFSILIAISVYDLRHKIIPDILVFSFIAISFIGNLVFGISDSFLNVLMSGFFITLPFFLLWFLSRGRWMGFGDVKLALGFGFLLGLIDGVYAILWSFWIGGAISTILLILSRVQTSKKGKSFLFSGLRRLTIKSEIPFGPFMVLGLAVAFFSNWDFLHLDLVSRLF